ncbi:hypothetical protein EBB79_18480 [Parasedimentitalea marina]|uniref:Uncharacterized protein n=1 Tax=Parasedimentitalea marina TaxID=2483033 RepID=A0A3T0N6K0_9RHOB|nr:hypothetical protein [Parasedimentitalea marina]AZV79663.1 hypothetical protein EBB79_18480 [Parasedimentitalea marina]
MKAIWAIVFLFVNTSTLAAKDVTGADSADFIQAKEAWLDGQDVEALQGLATLAREGHIPAKILLSRIADTPKFSAHITAQLSRKERINLFREPKGLSGRDWLLSASEESDLANALWVIQSSELAQPDYETIIPTLVAYGEIRPVFDYFVEMWDFEVFEFVAQILLENDEAFGAAGRYRLGSIIQSMANAGKPLPLPSTINTSAKAQEYLNWLRSDVNEFASSGLIRIASDRVAQPDDVPEYLMPFRFAHPDRAEDRVRLAKIVNELPELQPLRLFCETKCKTVQQEACYADGAWALMQAAAYPFPFASPAQSLIDDASYWGSPRFVTDVNRMLAKGNWPGCR